MIARIGVMLFLLVGCYQSHSPDYRDAAAASDETIEVQDATESPDGEMLRPQDPVVALSVGIDYACAVLESGDLYCWGNGDEGQIGQGEGESRAVPTRVEGLPPIRRVATDSGHACAVAQDGSAWCWGRNNWRQINSEFELRNVDRPLRVERDDRWAEIGVGTRHTCAINTLGDVWCWGTNAEAQVPGLSSERPFGPARVLLPAPAVRLDVHSKANCALLVDGRVVCWGGFIGHVGTGRTYRRTPFVFDLDAVEVAVGRGESRVDEGEECALSAGGEVWCWPRWQEMPTLEVPTPRLMPELESVAALDVGHAFACAVLRSGVTRCWGGVILRGNWETVPTTSPPDAPARFGHPPKWSTSVPYPPFPPATGSLAHCCAPDMSRAGAMGPRDSWGWRVKRDVRRR